MYIVRGTINAILLLAWTIVLLPIQIAAVWQGGALARALPRLYHRGVAIIIGLRIDVSGHALRQTPVLFVANHASWLDIVVLGALLEAGFIAKSEVATWPGVALLARLQGSVFVTRQRQKTARQADEIAAHLLGGRCLVLFPEGTSNDGRRVLAFRSGFFAVAERWQGTSPLPVQSISIAYVEHHGLPIGRADMPAFAWYGDMELAPHLWKLLCFGGSFRARVEFHNPVSIDSHPNRKIMAVHCESLVAAGVKGAQSVQTPRRQRLLAS